MFVSRVNVPSKLFLSRVALNAYFFPSPFIYYHGRADNIAKRGSYLQDMITDKDKRKHWHFNILPNNPKVRGLEKVHKPTRRQAVLNNVLIRTITDVMSTGDTVPELVNYGIEITGVKISPCSKILNVFWQVPVSQNDSCEDIGKLLIIAAPKIRAELISRNVLGRIPYIYFLRDSTNARIAEFQRAMENLDLPPETGIVVDGSFTKDIFSFKKTKVVKGKKVDIKDNIKEELSESMLDCNKEFPPIPEKPVDMKCNIFGLNHEQMMEKVIALKKRKKQPPQKTALISPDGLNEEDLFSKIPGVCFQVDSSRTETLKQFRIARKKFKEKRDIHCDDKYNTEEDNTEGDCDDKYNTEGDCELNVYDEDFIDGESTEN